MKRNNLKDLFKKAAEIVSEVPKNMQPVAFSHAIDILLGEAPDIKTSIKTKGEKAPPSRKVVGRKKDELVEQLLKDIDSTKYPIINKLDKVLERSLLVIKIANDEFKVDGLTAPQVATVLTDKFRLKTTRQAVAMVLKDAGNYVNRVPDGKAYKYKIMQPGDKHLAKIIEKKEKE